MIERSLLFVTGNRHKQLEASAVLPGIRLLTLHDIGWQSEIDEPFDTLEKNAKRKAETVYNSYQKDCFAEDTGLEVDALDGAPGVFTARYGGEKASAEDNYDLLLANLANSKNRKARFRSVLHLIVDDQSFQFEGILEGSISLEPKGSEGFGYDPVFVPDGYDKSLAQLSELTKNKISHRAIALRKMAQLLSNLI